MKRQKMRHNTVFSRGKNEREKSPSEPEVRGPGEGKRGNIPKVCSTGLQFGATEKSE